MPPRHVAGWDAGPVHSDYRRPWSVSGPDARVVLDSERSVLFLSGVCRMATVPRGLWDHGSVQSSPTISHGVFKSRLETPCNSGGGEVKAPLFSILHTSARPDKWRAVYDDWMAKCVRPEDVEYVLVIDPRWGFDIEDMTKYDTRFDNVHVVLNNRRRCYVDGVNLAAEASTGSILIVNADDQFACEAWDGELLRFGLLPEGEDLFVLEVSTGTPNEHERGVMVMPILSRARYEQQGYVFYPEYESMFADNDFCETARQDGVVIDARHLMFPHRHPMFDEKGRGGWSGDWQK